MHYHWSSSESLIHDVEFYAPHKKEEALVFAPMGADPARLHALAESIRAKGYGAVPDMQGDQAVLRVAGFPSREALLGTLQAEGAVKGEPTATKTDLDKKHGLKLSTLQIGGAMQVLADAMVMSVALSRGKEGMGDFMASLKWAWAYVMLSAFGAKSPDKQVGYIYKDLKDQIDKSGLQMVPEDVATLAALAEKSGVMPKVERAIRENPILINSLIQMSGGMSTIQAGNAQRDYDGNRNWWKVAGGSLTASGQLMGGILLDPKEKKKDENGNPVDDGQPAPHGLIDTVKAKIEEKPLRITGSFSFLSNVTRIVSGLVEKWKFKQFMGDTKNDYAGGIYAERRDKLFAEAQAGGHDLGKGGISLADQFSNAQTAVGNSLTLSRADKKAAVEHAKNMAQNDPYTLLCNRRDELLDTFHRVSRTKQAATVDFLANGIKMAANVMIASSSSNIDADLVKTGQLDEVCNFLAHVVQSQPEEKRATTLQALATMLSSKKGVAATEQQITQRIQGKLESLQHNPWDIKQPVIPTPPHVAPTTAPSAQVHQVAAHIAPQPAAVEAHL